MISACVLQPSFVSSQPWPSQPSACAPARYPRSYRGFPAVSEELVLIRSAPCRSAASRLCRQRSFPAGRRMPHHVAFVEPESELVNVPAKMLRADMVIDAIDAALQDRPNASMPLVVTSSRTNSRRTVIDRLVFEGQGRQASVAAMLIRVQGRAGFDASMDFGLDRRRRPSR